MGFIKTWDPWEGKMFIIKGSLRETGWEFLDLLLREKFCMQ